MVGEGDQARNHTQDREGLDLQVGGFAVNIFMFIFKTKKRELKSVLLLFSRSVFIFELFTCDIYPRIALPGRYFPRSHRGTRSGRAWGGNLVYILR